MAEMVSSARRGREKVCDGSLAILGLPCREEVIRTPKEGAGSIFPAHSLERKVVIVISSSEALVYQDETEQKLNSFRSQWHEEGWLSGPERWALLSLPAECFLFYSECVIRCSH